jgi:CRISPR/Cas system-associated exonuclease Cas4 (RecB family)
MRTFLYHDFPKLTYENVNGIRLYSIPGSDLRFPSVTAILSAKESPSLTAWKKRVGEKEADSIKNRAANKGTRFHKACEKYILDEKIEFTDPLQKELFLQIKPELDKVDNVHAMEAPMYSKKLKIAGRTDLIAEYNDLVIRYNNKISIIDYKTSKNIKKKNSESIEKYFIQTSAYAYMFWELFDIPVDNLVLFIVSENDNKPTIYQEHTRNWIPKFIEMRKEFKKTHNL